MTSFWLPGYALRQVDTKCVKNDNKLFGVPYNKI